MPTVGSVPAWMKPRCPSRVLRLTSPARAPELWHLMPKRLVGSQPASVRCTVAVFEPVYSPLYVFSVHLICTLPTVSRDAAPFLKVNDLALPGSKLHSYEPVFSPALLVVQLEA